jgi:hypothetical protein
LQERFLAIKETFREAPYYLKSVYVKHGEGVIAGVLNDVLAKFPQILLGSYPVLDVPDYKVKVTLESKDANYLDQALQNLLSSLPDGGVYRIE